MSIPNLIHARIDWRQNRMRERTCRDGLTIILISLMALAASPLIR